MIPRHELIRLLREFVSRSGEIADPADYAKAADLATRLEQGEIVGDEARGEGSS